MSVESRILLLSCLKKGLIGNDALIVIAVIETLDQYRPPLQSTDHFTEAIHLVKNQPFNLQFQSIIKLYSSFVSVLHERKIDLHAGIAVSKAPNLFREALEFAFCFNRLDLQGNAFVTRQGVVVDTEAVRNYKKMGVSRLLTSAVYSTDKGLELGLTLAYT